jgi:ubiquinone biosynthesis protein UbiJ
MGVLENLLQPAVALMNRQIQASTPARELCAELDGRVFAVRVRDTALVVYFVICPTRVSLHASVDGDADVIISGSLISLARLAASNDEALIRDGLVDLTGDAILALKFRKLLVFGRPDLEEELSGVVGDVVAHEAGNFLRGIGAWGRQAGDTISRNFVEYFQEESRALPSRYEADALSDQVNTLRDDVARFAARLKDIESNIAMDRS